MPSSCPVHAWGERSNALTLEFIGHKLQPFIVVHIFLIAEPVGGAPAWSAFVEFVHELLVGTIKPALPSDGESEPPSNNQYYGPNAER